MSLTIGKNNMKNKIDWKSLKSLNGYAADEVISALQKEIRRKNVDQAIFWAYEMCLSGEVFQIKLWERLVAIAVEDVGFGNPIGCVVIQSLKQAFWSEFEHTDDKYIQAMFAAAYLANSPKDRFIDEIKNYFTLTKKLIKIPEYALDKHTKKGKEMGRGDEYFWTVGNILKPELATRNKKYLRKIQKMVLVKK